MLAEYPVAVYVCVDAVYCRWVEVRMRRGCGRGGCHCFVAVMSYADCSQSTRKRSCMWVWCFQVYCVQHPALVTINRETEEDEGL